MWRSKIIHYANHHRLGDDRLNYWIVPAFRLMHAHGCGIRHHCLTAVSVCVDIKEVIKNSINNDVTLMQTLGYTVNSAQDVEILTAFYTATSFALTEKFLFI